MKKIFIATLFTCFMAMSGVASAKDMAKVSCAEFMRGDNVVKAYFVFWLDGFMSAQSDNTEMDDEWIKKLATHMGDYCRKNSTKTIMDAIEAMPEE